MTPPSLPTSAHLRRSLARRRVRELRHDHPVLEWLYGRLVVTETALGDLAREHAELTGACDQILRGNGYAAKVASPGILLESQLAAMSEAVGEPLLDTEKPTLLFVARDPLLLRTLRRVFERNFRVLVATTASHALTLLAGRAIDVVIADQELGQPNDGVRLLAHAKARFPEVERVLVSERISGDAAGAGEVVEHWVQKGSNVQVLFDRIVHSIERG